jgi:outer membrane protein OmpA-like peptidoglycan-associated protein
MKKLFLVLAAGMMAATVNAQNTAITSNKAGDNWYFGINAGVGFTAGFDNDGYFKNTKFKGIAPNAGLRIGKNLTTVFGLAAEASAYGLTNEKSNLNSKTFINATNISLLGTFNLSNLFSGYPGEPRAFEVIALGGFGWMHQYGNAFDKVNALTSKVALDFAFNLGADKAWQFYVEPNIVYALDGWANGVNANHGMKYNFNDAVLGINLGLNYKFGNSNGSHNFVKAQLRDQAEIDGLNAKINELRADNDAKSGQLSAKDQQIADLQKKLADCEARPVQIVENVKKETVLQPIVIFRQGKSTIDPAQYASVEMVAKYMRNHPEAKVLVRGYASPEGDAELNQRLSVARAEAVQTALINRYKIAADRITTEGLGATDKLSEEIDFNRVAMFVDTTK